MGESKTILEWFDELDEPYRSQAIANTKTEMLRNKDLTLIGALLGAFSWSESNEGFDYWVELDEQLSNKKHANSI